jgi:hypothetical protein
MSEQIRPDQPRAEQNNVVQLNPERLPGQPPQVILARLPAAMHSLRDKARQQLQGLLRDLFDKVDDAMFELADKANNNHDQNLYFDSMREVRLRRRAMEAEFFRSIDIRFAQLLDHNAYREETQTGTKEFSLDDLSLVKNDDLEEMVAIEGMVNKANEQFAEPIQHLTLRIDHLVPIKVYQKNNPLGVDVICNAFNDASKSLNIDVKAKLVLFKLFDNMVMTKLGGLFQSLNQLLIESNILPSLKQAPRAKRPESPAAHEHYGSGLSAALNSENSNQQHGSNIGNGQVGTGGSYDEQTNQVLHTLRDLLGSRGGVARDTGVHITGEEIASQDLVKILSLAQHQNTFTQASVASSGAPINIRELLQHLLTNNEQQKTHAINQVDDDVINLVSMMFDFILDDRNLASPMKALIGRLQIPMVKVAIADKTFFSKGGHPARRLLNEMAMAALGWQESSDANQSGEQRKDSLFSKMESTVQTILSDFDTDMSIFNNLLTDFRSFLEKDKRRASILEQRTIDAEDGKAKSERARLQVDSVLNRLTSGHDLPAPAQKLLRDAWGNVLFIISLKQGVESAEWQAGIRTAQQLVWSLTAPMSKENRQGLLKLVPQLLQKLREGLEDISYSPFETTQLFKQLETLHLARLRAVPKIDEVPAAVAPKVTVKLAEAPAPVVRIGVADVPAVKTLVDTSVVVVTKVLAAEPVVESVPLEAAVVPEIGVSKVEVPLEDLVSEVVVPEESATEIPVLEDVAVIEPLVPMGATLESLETFVVMSDEPIIAESADSLPEGDQHLSLVGNLTQGSWFEMQSEDGQKFRSRLAAIIRATGKYIFVNRSGVKVAEETRMSLALALKSGRLQVLDDGMLFDRALEAVIGNLRNNR